MSIQMNMEAKVPAVFEHLTALVNDQRNRVPDSAKVWQTLVKAAHNLRDDRNFVQDEDLGRYIYGFLSDASWVKRALPVLECVGVVGVCWAWH